MLDWQDLGAPSQAFDLQSVPSMSQHKEPLMIPTHLSISWVLSLLGAGSFIPAHVVSCVCFTARLQWYIIMHSMLTVHNICECVILKENAARDNTERKHTHLIGHTQRSVLVQRHCTKQNHYSHQTASKNTQLKISKVASSDQKASEGTISDKMVTDKTTRDKTVSGQTASGSN